MVIAVILFFSILITTFNSGFFSLGAVTLLLGLYILLLLVFFRPGVMTNKDNKLFLPLLLITTYSLFLFFAVGIYQTSYIPSVFLTFLVLFAFMIVFTYLLPFKSINQQDKKKRYYSLLIFAVIFRFLIILASPTPIIDIFTMLKEAPFKLIAGINPYEASYSSVYPGVLPNYYTYWPASFLFELPFVYLFKDPRILLAISDIGSAVLLYRLGKGRFLSEILSLVYLFRPNSNFMIEQSYLAPLEFLLFLGILSVSDTKRYLKDKKDLYIGLLSALLVAVRQQYLIIVPFLSFFSSNLRKFILGFASTITILVLPFMWWNKEAFIKNTIYFFFQSPDKIPNVPIYRSLSLNTLFYLFTGGSIPTFIVILVVMIASAFIFIKVNQREKKSLRKLSYPNVSQVLLGIILVLLSAYILVHHVFINYYYVITGLLIAWVIFLEKEYKL